MRARSMIILAATILGACGGGSCPEARPSATSGAEAPMLREPTTAPESIVVTIGGLDTAGRFPMAQVFSGFGCTGENHSPALTWTGAPVGTQSFAVVMHDPDAPTGVGFFHWIVVDLPAGTATLAEGATLPDGAIQTYTDFGTSGYGGPCPPPGAPHRYEITVYALDVPSLGVQAGATGALVRFMLRQHSLAIGRAQGSFGQ